MTKGKRINSMTGFPSWNKSRHGSLSYRQLTLSGSSITSLQIHSECMLYMKTGYPQACKPPRRDTEDETHCGCFIKLGTYAQEIKSYQLLKKEFRGRGGENYMHNSTILECSAQQQQRLVAQREQLLTSNAALTQPSFTNTNHKIFVYFHFSPFWAQFSLREYPPRTVKPSLTMSC